MEFHVLSFEGPDPYARVGGLATRIEGLTHALAGDGYRPHLWFCGDPDARGHETREGVQLHRWCQWISRHHRTNVYDGEDSKAADYAASLPPFLLHGYLIPAINEGEQVVVMAEEWQTANAVIHLDHMLREAGLRHRVTILWNANNNFGFDRIDWKRLERASSVTAVSRYMRHKMPRSCGDALVIPNGLSPDAYDPPEKHGVQHLRRQVRDRLLVAKMARWDPDKRWLGAVRSVAEMKSNGWRPLLVARGGTEPHGAEVLAEARAAGLRIVDRDNPTGDLCGFLGALSDLGDADFVNVRTAVDPDSRRVLFRAADAVLANSSHEPFGLVGLETMAVGGIACTGCSGEDYAIPGRNALVLQTEDPSEFLGLYHQLRTSPPEINAMRRAGRTTARQYAWPEVIRRNLLPRIDLMRDRGRQWIEHAATIADGSASADGACAAA